MSSDDNDSPELIMSADAFIENDISAFQVDVKGLEPAKRLGVQRGGLDQPFKASSMYCARAKAS
jgi:hypothetical protein